MKLLHSFHHYCICIILPVHYSTWIYLHLVMNIEFYIQNYTSSLAEESVWHKSKIVKLPHFNSLKCTSSHQSILIVHYHHRRHHLVLLSSKS